MVMNMSDLIKVDKEYADWIRDVSIRFKQSQLKAASKVNAEMLEFYWHLGRDIARREQENRYGSGFYNNLSLDLQHEIPDVKSFSVTNLHYMRWFYELYPNVEILPQAGVESVTDENLPQTGVNLSEMVFHIP